MLHTVILRSWPLLMLLIGLLQIFHYHINCHNENPNFEQEGALFIKIGLHSGAFRWH